MATNQMNDVLQYLRRAVLQRDGAGLTDGQLLETYLRSRDEAALAALVWRHSPMVWGVCRRVLRNYHDVEDAFQATFLVLVRKAASIASRELLANWLYGVAHQTALKARGTAARRKERERQVIEMPEPPNRNQETGISGQEWDELQRLLDQELSRLPDKYRSVIVLCELEGKTRKEAARQLGVPEGTVGGWSARARAMLAKRLARRGLAVSGAALATMLAHNCASAGVPASAVSNAIKAASLFAAGQAAATGAISVKVVALTEGMLKTMLLTKLKTLLIVMGVMAVAGGLIINGTAPAQQSRAEKARRNYNKAQAKAAEPHAATVEQERKRFEGTWQFGSYEVNGTKLTKAEIEELVVRPKLIRGAQEEGRKPPSGKIGGVFLVFDAEGKWKLQSANGAIVEEGTCVIDPAKGPNTLDLTGTIPGTKQTRTHQGIYEFVNEDTCRICLASEKERPSDFATKPNSGRTLWVLERVKSEKGDRAVPKTPPGNEADSPKPDIDRLQGNWEWVSWTQRGITVSVDKLGDQDGRPKSMKFAGDKVLTVMVNGDGKEVEFKYVFKLNASRKPKEIDLIPDGENKGKSAPGLYELDGDTLRVCFPGQPDEERPAKLESTEGQNYILMTYKRIAKKEQPLPGNPIQSSDDLRGEWTGEKNGIKVDLRIEGAKAHWQVQYSKIRKPENAQQSPAGGVDKGADLKCVVDAKTGRLHLHLPAYLGDDQQIKQSAYNGVRPVGQIQRGTEGTLHLRIVPTGYENLALQDYDYPAVEGLILRRVAKASEKSAEKKP